MGFLAPFYIAGLLAVGLPILFHLIRRNPKGRQVFSSLMFLTPSPPALTRKSRLTNIVLLILRALALTLLAIAFARPFVHQGSDLDKFQGSGRRIAILVDSSASMQRPGLWAQAKSKIDDALKDITPADEVALFFFDRGTRTALSFAEWNQADPATRLSLFKSRAADVQPTWAPTRLGDAVATVAGLVAENENGAVAEKNDPVTRHVILISDLQQGSHADALQGHEWPKDVTLDVRPVGGGAGDKTSNASVQWVQQSAEESATPDTRLRVRVTNDATSTKEQFTLNWANAQGILHPKATATASATAPATSPQTDTLKVYVAPGRSQTVRIPWPDADSGAGGADRLVLSGDDCDFDNTLFVVPPRIETVRLVFLGDDAPNDVNGLRYYVDSALADTPRRKVEIVARHNEQTLTDSDLANARLVIVTGAPSDATVARLRTFLDTGDVLWVLKDTTGAPALAGLLGIEPGAISEAAPGSASRGGYALIGRVDTQHPLFAPFADARFGDFTRIHFWKHRTVKLPPGEGAILAAFDNGDPFLIEKAIGTGKGRLRVLTAGWQPADSQFALSTKFVPLLEGLLRRRDEVLVDAQYTVQEPIALPPPPAGNTQRTLIAPDGQRISIPPTTVAFEGADHPGIYKLLMNNQETLLAVNLPPDESRIAPMGADELERWGARLAGSTPGKNSPETVQQERKLKIAELENHQKLWRWLVVVVLGLLAVETALAGRLARRAPTHQGVA